MRRALSLDRDGVVLLAQCVGTLRGRVPGFAASEEPSHDPRVHVATSVWGFAFVR